MERERGNSRHDFHGNMPLDRSMAGRIGRGGRVDPFRDHRRARRGNYLDFLAGLCGDPGLSYWPLFSLLPHFAATIAMAAVSLLAAPYETNRNTHAQQSRAGHQGHDIGGHGNFTSCATLQNTGWPSAQAINLPRAIRLLPTV